MPTDADLAAVLDAVIEKRPFVDTYLLTVALENLCRARDELRGPAEAARRERICLLIALVMGVKHPINAPPWDALVQARGGLPAEAVEA
jgi:hypothetical protein